MTPWFALLIIFLDLSSRYISTYRLYNFGHNSGVIPPLLNRQGITNCFLTNHWSQCPVLPRDMVLNMLADSYGRGAHYQSERLLHRLFEVGLSHNRRTNTGHLATYYGYPYYTEPSLSWPLRRNNMYQNILMNPPYPKSPTTSSTLEEDNLFTNILINSGTRSAGRLKDKNLFQKRQSSSSDSKLTEVTTPAKIDPTTETTLVRSAKPFVIADANVHNFLTADGFPQTLTTARSPDVVKTTSIPINKLTPLIYNVEIGVNTKSDDWSIKKFVTINEFTEIPKHPNHTMTLLSTNALNENDSKNNHTSSTSTHFRISSSKLLNNTNSKELEVQRKNALLDSFSVALDKLERKFYSITFNKLISTSPADRQENGISFVQSGLFLSLQLMTFSTEVDQETKDEIDQCLGLIVSDADKINIIEEILRTLPKSNFDLKWRWSSRLILGASQDVSEEFRCGAASALQLSIGKFHGNETDEMLASTLNQMIEEDSGGAIRDTFDPEELSEGVRAVAMTTLYMRGRWRSAPTVLNGTRPFYDAGSATPRAVRMIRINDYVRYAHLTDWNFEAIEISYATRGLSLLLLVPQTQSLRQLANLLDTVSIAEICAKMITMRVAVTMPLYTLRMTLLLPSKLKALGINNLMGSNNSTDNGRLKLSHAIQRVMFWAEAGRNAFKDDGIEWDAEPELELVVDRPYLFFVRWHNITLMNGNFVL